jgi:4-hydroxybenzoate polyprenyltransferase
VNDIAADSAIPLCLGLDGTLTPVRTAHERLLLAARHGTSSDVQIDVTTLPLRSELLAWLRQQRAIGRRLVLVADGDPATAKQIAAHLDLFDEIASTERCAGTAAQRKRSALVARFGEHGFDYIGSDASDRIVWDASRQAIVVGNADIARRLGRGAEVLSLPGADGASWRTWIRAIRLHQWVKNGLIFVPAVLAHVISQPHVLRQGALAFLAFGLCASSVYLVNDLFDLAADRRHPRKRLRPFAAGLLSARSGISVALVLTAAAAIIAVTVGRNFVAVLAGYYALTWAYSLQLKRVPLLDVMTLAALYTLRIIAGAAAMSIELSFWLLAFSVFIFLSLGFVKRYAELEDTRRAGKLSGQIRGYRESDLPLIMSLGTASSYSAIVVMALYINSADSQSLYRHHKPLWLICPLMLFWISRVWILSSRGEMHDDPVVFALRDRLSLAVLAALGVIVLISI